MPPSPPAFFPDPRGFGFLFLMLWKPGLEASPTLPDSCLSHQRLITAGCVLLVPGLALRQGDTWLSSLQSSLDLLFLRLFWFLGLFLFT